MVTNDSRIESSDVREPSSTQALIVIEELPVERLRDENGGDWEHGLLLASLASAIAAIVGAFLLP